MTELLRVEDIEYISYLMSPQWIIPRAKKYGAIIASQLWNDHNALVEEIANDGRFLAVLGAYDAGKESRSYLRKYIRYIRWRDNKLSVRDLNLAQSLRRAGYIGGFQVVRPLNNITPWRKTSGLFWPSGDGKMYGTRHVKVGNVRQKIVDVAVIKAVSEVIVKHPSLNRAYLQGKLWQRTTGHIMLHLEPAREQVRSIIIDPSKLDFEILKERLPKTIKAIVKAEKNELSFFVDKLLEEWIKVGFIASPAAAMVSCCGSKGGIIEGSAPLLTNINGIGIAVVAGKVEDGIITLQLEMDHRLFDATQISIFWKYLIKRIPELVGG